VTGNDSFAATLDTQQRHDSNFARVRVRVHDVTMITYSEYGFEVYQVYRNYSRRNGAEFLRYRSQITEIDFARAAD